MGEAGEVIVYGASDDLIEIEGAIVEEFTAEDEADRLIFSDGTVLEIRYTREGVWRIEDVHRGTARLTVDVAPDGDEDNYSDRATLEGVTWVIHGGEKASA
jgi:hypothetical protein